MADLTSKPDLANHVRVYTGRLFYDGSYTDEQRWVKAEFFEALRARLAVETSAELLLHKSTCMSMYASPETGRYACDCGAVKTSGDSHG